MIYILTVMLLLTNGNVVIHTEQYNTLFACKQAEDDYKYYVESIVPLNRKKEDYIINEKVFCAAR